MNKLQREAVIRTALELLNDVGMECVGQTNQVGLSRAGFEEGAGRNLVAVRGPAEGCRRAVE